MKENRHWLVITKEISFRIQNSPNKNAQESHGKIIQLDIMIFLVFSHKNYETIQFTSEQHSQKYFYTIIKMKPNVDQVIQQPDLSCFQKLKQTYYEFKLRALNYFEWDRILNSHSLDTEILFQTEYKKRYNQDYQNTYSERQTSFGYSFEQVSIQREKQSERKKKRFCQQLKRFVCCFGGNLLDDIDNVEPVQLVQKGKFTSDQTNNIKSHVFNEFKEIKFYEDTVFQNEKHQKSNMGSHANLRQQRQQKQDNFQISTTKKDQIKKVIDKVDKNSKLQNKSKIQVVFKQQNQENNQQKLKDTNGDGIIQVKEKQKQVRKQSEDKIFNSSISEQSLQKDSELYFIIQKQDENYQKINQVNIIPEQFDQNLEDQRERLKQVNKQFNIETSPQNIKKNMSKRNMKKQQITQNIIFNEEETNYQQSEMKNQPKQQLQKKEIVSNENKQSQLNAKIKRKKNKRFQPQECEDEGEQTIRQQQSQKFKKGRKKVHIEKLNDDQQIIFDDKDQQRENQQLGKEKAIRYSQSQTQMNNQKNAIVLSSSAVKKKKREKKIRKSQDDDFNGLQFQDYEMLEQKNNGIQQNNQTDYQTINLPVIYESTEKRKKKRSKKLNKKEEAEEFIFFE